VSKFKHLPQLNLHGVILFVYTMNLYSKALKWLMCASNSLPIYSTNSRMTAVGHLFSNAINREQGNTNVND
jgi:hypothetical protein